MTRIRVFFALGSFLLLSAPATGAAVPDPTQSVCFQQHIVVEPAGNLFVDFWIKDAAGAEIAGSTVSIDFNGDGFVNLVDLAIWTASQVNGGC